MHSVVCPGANSLAHKLGQFLHGDADAGRLSSLFAQFSGW